MKHRSTLVTILFFTGVLAFAALLVGAGSAAAAPYPPAAAELQTTVIVETPFIGITPPVVVTGTAGVPATGESDPIGGSWLFLAILVVAGLAFLVAIFALMRRPYP